MREGKIGVRDATAWVLFMIVPKLMLTSPSDVAEMVGSATWLMTLIAVATALLLFWFVSHLFKWFPGEHFIAILENIFGRWLGGLLALVMAATFFYNGAMTARELEALLKTFFLPLSPPEFILLLISLAVAALLYFGFESLSRTAGFFMAPVLWGVVLIFVLAIPNYQLAYLFPLFGYGLDKTIMTGLMRNSVYGDVISLAVIAPSLQGLVHLRKSGIAGVAIAGFFVAMGLMCYSLNYSYITAKENTVPLLIMARGIEFGRFFQRFETIFLFIWSISCVLMVAINLYMAASIYGKVFRIDDHKVMILPLALILNFVALYPRDLDQLTTVHIHGLRTYGWFVYFGIPLAALGVAWIGRKRGKRYNAKK
ncbi:GerAB/ArcD/ProY family transporter [Heliophilum fasciatum]|uniref:Spore germination protein (Amino acid permease) n=1 Tax=Heliophilum fasciatum TaxID=35700 RepID=A0A4R2RM89_9FIRM|nr:endospore germination permease [Heliophilum fasciatum]MCW2278358.1 spore germination protein (amino acid permease) [Heliophilum fasciatum]TCP63769.1 spore germination protein (amino acid permease) [Heliophilum fasciatum]